MLTYHQMRNSNVGSSSIRGGKHIAALIFLFPLDGDQGSAHDLVARRDFENLFSILARKDF